MALELAWNSLADSQWKKRLQGVLHAPEMEGLRAFLEVEYQNERCYPAPSDIFQAFEQCPWESVKVVLLGQDPYHGPGQAHGLSFSVADGMALPPSLRNVFREAKDDVGGSVPMSGNLSFWARQGVLLLNTVLTVRAHVPNSHRGKGWEQVTDAVIRMISKEHVGVVFMLWGNDAQRKSPLINEKKHLLLKTGHPSPMSANRGHWFGSKPFSKANSYLCEHGKTPIQWLEE